MYVAFVGGKKMAKTVQEKENILRELLGRLDYETESDESDVERRGNVVNVIEKCLSRFADSDQIEAFYEELRKIQHNES